MGFAEGYRSGAAAIAAGEEAGATTGKMIAGAGAAVGDAIADTRRWLQDREWKKDAEKRAPAIREHLKSLEAEAVLKNEAATSMVEQMRQKPGSIDKDTFMATVHDAMMSRANARDAQTKFLMEINADFNPYIQREFKPMLGASLQMMETDQNRLAGILGDLETAEGTEFMRGQEERRTKADELRAQAALRGARAEETRAAKDTGADPAKKLDAWLDALEVATSEFDNMPGDDQQALVKLARERTGREDLTLSQIKRDFTRKWARRSMRQAGFTGYEEPERGETPAAPPAAPAEPAAPPSPAESAGREAGEFLREAVTTSAPYKVASDMIRSVDQLAEFIYGVYKGKPEQE